MAGNERYHVLMTTRRRKNRKMILVTIATVVLLIAIIVLAVVFVVLPNMRKSSVSSVATDTVKSEGIYRRISNGVVEGTIEKAVDGTKIYSFKGIPFALPPTGKRRWKAPEPLPLRKPYWTGIRKADKYSSSCAQLKNYVHPTGKEDCLYLNVWTPAFKKSKSLPVFVYIHGGSLTVGSGQMPGFPDLTRAGIVGVSMNYRLNAFGFLTLKVFSEASRENVTSNFGFVDQIEALRWVQRNIEEFGGNPDHVCIVGFSAGGTSVQALLTSPLASGLFHSAYLLSASTIYHMPQAKAVQDNQVFVKRANCEKSTSSDVMDCLHKLTTKEVLKAIPWKVYPSWGHEGYGELPSKGVLYGALAVVDDVVVPSSPVNLANMKEKPKFRIPVFVGTSAQEMEIPKPEIENLTLPRLIRLINASFSTFDKTLTSRVMKAYGITNLTKNLDIYFPTIFTDSRMYCQAAVYLRNASRSNNHTFYQFLTTNRPSYPIKTGNVSMKYSFHYWAVYALFNFQIFSEIPGRPTKNEQIYADQLQSDFISFVKTGKPATTTWLPVTSSTYYEYGNGFNRVVRGEEYHEEQCRVLMGAGLYDYGLML